MLGSSNALIDEYRVVSYARKSKHKLGGEHSIDGQLAEQMEFSEKNKWKWITAYQDGVEADASGGTMNREGIQKLINDVEKQEIRVKGIVISHPDRLSRDVQDTLFFVDKMKNYGVRIHFISMPQIDCWTDEGRYFLTQMASLAEYQRKNIGKHVKRGIKQKMRKGEWFGQAPYGFSILSDKEEGSDKARNTRLSINKEEMKIRNKIKDMWIEGNTINEIKEFLDSNQIHTRRGKIKWNYSTIRSIIKQSDDIFEYVVDDELEKNKKKESVE